MPRNAKALVCLTERAMTQTDGAATGAIPEGNRGASSGAAAVEIHVDRLQKVMAK